MIVLEDVKLRLASLGYIFIAGDAWVLGFIIEKLENHIKSKCNTLEVPTGLYQSAVDMVVGEFLLGKKSNGQLTGFNFETAVKSIQEGDTNVTFGSGSKTPEERFDELISFLMHSEVNYSSYRRLKW